MSDADSHTTFEAPPIEEIASLFPAYDIETLIATGGMGAVYRAIQRSLDRTVAIKILPEVFSTDASFCASFEAEAKAMARLNHPNLIGVYDFGEVNGMLFIVMEYVPGQSLFHSSHGQAIDPGEVIRLVAGIADGLAHAHENGILHRDIKPSNILLDLDAEPKIGDFGLARPADRTIEEGEEIFGTPHYTAPEVVHSPHTVDARADIFSLGVLLHELLTGRLPADDPRPPSAICLCDHRFDAIVRRATDPHPERRYASAAEIAADLRKIANSPGPRLLTTPQPAAPRPVSHNPVPVKVKSSSGAPVLLILLLLAVAGGGYFFLKQRKQPTAPAETPAEPPATLPTEITPAPPAPDAPPVSNTPPAPESPPAPDPVLPPEPSPSPAPSLAPEATPQAETSPAPKFDVDAFLTRAHGIMREKAAPSLTRHEQALSANMDAFLDALQPDPGSKPIFERKLESAEKNWKQNGNRIPEQPNEFLTRNSESDGVHALYLAKQQAIDTTLNEELAALCSTYIRGLELQLNRLAGQNDPGAVALINREINHAKADPDHFSLLMRNQPTGD